MPDPKAPLFVGAVASVGAFAALGAGSTLRNKMYPPTYRLYLGGKRGENLIPAKEFARWQSRILDKKLPGYSLSSVKGFWGGLSEPSRVVEFVGGGGYAERAKMQRLSRSYAKVFGQEAVLETAGRSRVKFVGSAKSKSARRAGRAYRLLRLALLRH